MSAPNEEHTAIPPVPPSDGNPDFESNVQNHVQELQETVCRLLRYAVSDANREVTEDILEKTVPLLNKPADQFTPENEQSLWSIYNSLSRLITPATNESLWLKEQIERDDRDQAKGRSEQSAITKAYLRSYNYFTFSGLFFGLLFFLLQSYTFVLSDSLNKVDHYYSDINTVENLIAAAKQANKDLSICKPPLKDLLVKRDVLRQKIVNHYKILNKLSFLWGFIYSNQPPQPYTYSPPDCPKDTTDSEANPTSSSAKGNPTPTTGSSENPIGKATVPHEPKYSSAVDDKNQAAEAGISTFFEGAKSVLRICNYVALPFFMGILGSLAFVIRAILDSFSRASLTLGFRRRGIIRVFLGGLLGLISGIVIASDIKEFKEISYSPLVWAFLMGYSVEFAFSIFDALIERGRRALDTVRDPVPPIKTSNNPSDKNNPNV